MSGFCMHSNMNKRGSINIVKFSSPMMLVWLMAFPFTVGAHKTGRGQPVIEADDDIDQIVGGQAASIGSYPFQAAFVRNNEDVVCGGSLISSSHILTAAHCVDYLEPADYSSLKIRINTTTINPFDPESIEKSIRKIARHKSYKADTGANDIAIVTLDSPVAGITPVQLPPVGNTLSYAGSWATIVGFGRTEQTMAAEESTGNGSNVLKETLVQIISNSQCSLKYKSSNSIITPSMICAFAADTDACQGDSGGPLLVGQVQVGIISWANGCADPDFPGVYTRLTQYSSWIKTNTA